MVTAAVVLLDERFLTLISQKTFVTSAESLCQNFCTNYQHVAKSISFQATLFWRQHPLQNLQI